MDSNTFGSATYGWASLASHNGNVPYNILSFTRPFNEAVKNLAISDVQGGEIIHDNGGYIHNPC